MLPSNFPRGTALQTILRQVVRMDPLAASMARDWRKEMTADEAICYFTGRLHGALFQLGYEKIEFDPIYDTVKGMVEADTLVVAKVPERP